MRYGQHLDDCGCNRDCSCRDDWYEETISELVCALRLSLAQLEEWEVVIENEFGGCGRWRNLKDMEEAGDLSVATVAAKVAIKKITGEGV